MPKFGHQTSWQYILEDSTEVPTSSTVPFRLPGAVTGETSFEPKFSLKEFRALKQPSDTDMRRSDHIQPSKNEYGWGITYVPIKRLAYYDFRHFHNCVMNNTSSTTAAGGRTYGTSLTTNLRTITIFKEIDNLQHQVLGGAINRLTMRSSIDNPVEITVDGMASNATFANLARTDATTLRDGTPFMWNDVTVFIDGALATFCTAFEYTINNNADGNYILGERDARSITVKGRSIEGVITRQYADTGQYLAAKNGTAKSITIVLDDTADVNIGFRDCKWESHPIPPEADGLLVHQLRFRAETAFTN